MKRITIVTILASLLLSGLASGQTDRDNLTGQQAAHAFQQTDFNGDPMPHKAVARFGTAFLTHPGECSFLAVSPDNKLLASGGNDRICVWDLRRFERIRSIVLTKPQK